MATMETMERLSTLTDAQYRIMQANEYCRWLVALRAAGGSALSAKHFILDGTLPFSTLRTRFLEIDKRVSDWHRTKAVSNPGTTTEPAWAAPIAVVQPYGEALIELSKPMTLIGRVLEMARQVPFNISMPVQTGGGTYAWIGQGAPAPVGNMQLATATLPILKAGGIIVVSDELLKVTTLSAVTALRGELTRGLAYFLDAQLVDPTVAAVPNVSPASITNQAPSIGSAGSSAANAATDAKKLMSDFMAANPGAEPVLLMSPSVAVALAIATNSTTLTARGGSLFGATVLTSAALGGRVVVLDPTALLVADENGLEVDISKQASVEMQNPATSPVTASTVLVNLWALNLTGLRVTRFINYKMARANAVLWTTVAYV